MSRLVPLVRAVFREAVDYPGDDPGNQFKLESPETIFPRRGAMSAGEKRPYQAFHSEGFVIIENCRSKNRVRVPMSNVKLMVYEDDVPKEKSA